MKLGTVLTIAEVLRNDDEIGALISYLFSIEVRKVLFSNKVMMAFSAQYRSSMYLAWLLSPFMMQEKAKF